MPSWSRTRHFVILFLILFFYLLVAVNFIFPNLFPKPEKSVEHLNRIVIFKPDTSNSHSQAELSEHNTLVRSMLLEYMTMDNAIHATHLATKTQMRGFYLAILAGLLALLFRGEKTSQQAITWIILSVIVAVYVLEVHEDDMAIRSRAWHNIYARAVDSLTELRNSEAAWYILDEHTVRAEMNTLTDLQWCVDGNSFTAKMNQLARSNRLIRKGLRAVRPDLDQFLLFLLPFACIYVRKLKEDATEEVAQKAVDPKNRSRGKRKADH
jgi:hypothetical protein